MRVNQFETIDLALRAEDWAILSEQPSFNRNKIMWVMRHYTEHLGLDWRTMDADTARALKRQWIANNRKAAKEACDYIIDIYTRSVEVRAGKARAP